MKQSEVVLYSTSWRGGDGWYTHALADGMAAALAEHGVRLRLVASTMEPADKGAQHPNVARDLLVLGHRAGAGRLTKIALTARRAAAATCALLRARRTARVYVVTFPHWLSVTVLQFALLKLLGARLVYVVHDPAPHAWSPNALIRGMQRIAIKSSYLLADKLVTLTRAGSQVLQSDFGMSAAKLAVIPHGVFDSGQKALPKSNRTFLIFGMLRSNKQILESIQAFARLHTERPEVRLVIAGAPYSAEKNYWARCEAEILALGSAVSCEIGFVEESRLQALFDECDAVLLPYANFNSQSGVAVLAALSMRPVVGTESGGISELYEMGMEGIRIEGHPTAEAIYFAMSKYCATPPLDWDSRLHKARQLILAKCSWKEIGKTFATAALHEVA
jgi:glycogen synthase